MKMRKKLLIIGMLVATLHHSPTHGAASLWDTTTRQAQSWWSSITQTLTPYTNYLQENIRRYLYPATPAAAPSPVQKPTRPTVPQTVQQQPSAIQRSLQTIVPQTGIQQPRSITTEPTAGNIPSPEPKKATQEELLEQMNTAIWNKDAQKVQALLNAGVDPNGKAKNGESPLSMALFWDQPAITKLLLDKKANPNGKAKNFMSLLEYALYHYRHDHFELLLNAGADPNSKTNAGESLLEKALRREEYPIVSLLFAKGAIIDPALVKKIVTEELWGYGIRKLEKILDAGLNPNSKTTNGAPILQYIIDDHAYDNQRRERSLDTAKLLLNKGADPNIKTSEGLSLLEFALAKDREDIAALLINRGAKTSATTKDGIPLIHYAYNRGSKPLMEALVKHGASIDHQNNEGATILTAAVINKQLDWIESVLKLGANPSIKDKRGLDAFDWAGNNPVLTRILKTSTHAQPAQQEQEPKELHNARLAQMYQALSDSGKLKKQKEISTPYELHHQASEKTTSEIYRNLFQEEILAKYGDAIDKYEIDILNLIHREREYWKTHYVFYHAQEAIHRIPQDFWLEILSLLHLKNPQDFIPLRFPELQDTLQTSTVQDFLLKNKILPDCKKNDLDNNIAHNLLSVNIALFGNIKNTGESSIYYYLNSISIKKLTTEQILNKMTAYYAFNAQLVKSLASIEQPISQNFGNLLQIFIPKSLVDKCTYLSLIHGCPYKKDLGVGGYNQEYTYQEKISPVIEAIQNGTLAKKFDKEKLKSILDTLQARIILAKDIALNPESGVKIFREVSAPPKLLEFYKQKMQTISRKIIIDWVGRIQNNTMPTEVLERVATTPLGAVLRDKQKTEKLLKELIDLDTSATIRPQQAPPLPPRAKL